MATFKLLVDTGSDIPQHYLEQYDISIVPLHVIRDGVSQRDYYELDGKEFCQYLRSCKTIPTTSQPSPAEFLEVFHRFSGGYDHILCFTMAPAGSGTYNSACLAKGMFDEEHLGGCTVDIIDSKSCSLVETLEARAAGERIAQGASREEVLAALEDLRHRVATFYLVDNIDYLIRGGRVSVTKGIVASALNLKPIVCIRKGEGSILGSALGYKKGIDKLIGYYQAEAVENACLYISHSDCVDKANRLIERFREHYPDAEVVCNQMFCTMSTQAGPDTVAIFYEKKR